MKLSVTAGYLQGLADGSGVDESTPNGKLTASLLKLVAEMAERIEELEKQVEDLSEYAEELDSDLGDVEEYLFADEDDEDYEDEDDDTYEVTCPACGEVICFDGSIDPEELACPACGEKFECIIAEEDLNALDEQ